MKYTILLLLAFVMGCTAQRPMYSPAKTTVTVDTSTTEISKRELNAENEQIRKELEDLKKTVKENMEETHIRFVAMDERLFATKINLTESSQKLAFMELTLVGQSQVQESLSLSLDQLSKEYTTKYDGMLNQMASDTNQLFFDLQSRLSETDMTLKETVNKFEEFKTKFEAEIQTGKNSDKIDLLSGKLGERNSAIENLRTDFEETKQNLADTNSALKQLQEDFRVRGLPKSIGKMPTSCADLKQIGYIKSGVYSVAGGKNVLNVYCDFTVDDKKMEKLIGPPSN